MTDVVICGAKRTPMGGFQGELSSLAAPDLGATAIRGALDEAGALLTVDVPINKDVEINTDTMDVPDAKEG